jgi:hypothetical protein
MKIEFVEHNGVRMPKGWPEEIEKAQDVTKIKIAGRLRDRVRYGSGESRSCHDCRVSAGQLHVVGCDDEKCPACGMLGGGALKRFGRGSDEAEQFTEVVLESWQRRR